jgi:ABC-type dipeptide/oligopeptide/nickel transport system permease subunit
VRGLSHRIGAKESMADQDAVIPNTTVTLPSAASPAADTWRRLRRNPIAVASGLFILALILVALFARFLAPYGYDTPDYNLRFAPPSPHHLLGTDNQGRDVFSRILYGAQVSLGVAIVVVTLSVSIGVPLGLVAGYFSGWTDLALMRVTDVMFAFPDILLAILLSSMVRAGNRTLPPILSFLTLFFALGVVGWPGLARLVRGQALALREKEFIEAARAMGVRDRSIIGRHLLPNLLSPIIVQVTQDIAGVFLAEATLSFLGLGVQAPFPSWGRMIDDARQLKGAHPLLLIAPSAMLALTVMAFNFFGDALRDALDPRLRQ